MIAVTASSFLKNKYLCNKLQEAFPSADIRFIQLNDGYQTSELLGAIQGCSVWLIGREICDRKIIQNLPQLRLVSKYGVGLDNIDLDACRELGIKVAWESGVNREAVAEHTVGLMLATMRHIGLSSRLLSVGRWVKNGGRNLTGAKVGVIGLGSIGLRVAELLQTFRCTVRFCDLEPKQVESERLQITRASLEDILRWADCITFHVPLTSETRHMLNSQTLQLVKPGVYVINTSRGEVIDQMELKAALETGLVGGAGLDVFEVEPLTDKDLYSMDKVVCTPHIAGNSQEAVKAMGEAAIRGIQKELSSHPR